MPYAFDEAPHKLRRYFLRAEPEYDHFAAAEMMLKANTEG